MKFWNNFLDYDLWQSFCNQIFVVLKISIETLNKRTYEKVTFYHIPNGILVCDNSKRQETQSRMA